MSTRERLFSLVKEEVGRCQQCSLFPVFGYRVFGEGNINADLIFIGESPGEEEQKTGRPFVGKSGKLLDKMIINMGLKREDIYIANIIKCRPPDNRKPTEEEINCCLPFLKMQLMLLGNGKAVNKILITLGATATDALLGPGPTISKRRGKIHNKIISETNFTIIPTFHPSYLLRNPSVKKEAADDLSLALKTLREYESF